MWGLFLLIIVYLQETFAFLGISSSFCLKNKISASCCKFQFAPTYHAISKGSNSISCTRPTDANFRYDDIDSKYLQSSIGTEWLPLIFNTSGQNFQGLRDISWISDGVRIWNRALKSGRTPDRFLDSTMIRYKNNTEIWPAEPLFSRFSEVAQKLSLPRFVQRHPELAPSILRGLLLLSYELEAAMSNSNISKTSGDICGEGENGSEIKNEEDVAAELVEEFMGTWAPALQGLGVLDSLFGTGHGLLAPGTGQSPEGADQAGFGLEDGIWRHTGWAEAPALQEQIQRMPALKQMVPCRAPRASLCGCRRRARVLLFQYITVTNKLYRPLDDDALAGLQSAGAAMRAVARRRL
jgi:hypothetical protein